MNEQESLPAVPDTKEEERVLPAFYCLKCRNTFREIGGKQYRDGDVAQWCPHCGASDDHIYELSAQEQAGMFIPPVLEKKETGGRNALNLQGARKGKTTEYKRGSYYLSHTVWQDGHEEVEIHQCVPQQLVHWFDGEKVTDVKGELHSCDPKQFADLFKKFNSLPDALQSAQAASDGKEQGTSNMTHDRPIVKEESQCHTDETKQRDERRDANTPVKYESAPAERSVEGTATETISRDARPGSSGSASEFCPEIADSSNAMGVSSPESSSAAATVLGPMEELNGVDWVAWTTDRIVNDLHECGCLKLNQNGIAPIRALIGGYIAGDLDRLRYYDPPSGIEGQPAQEVSKTKEEIANLYKGAVFSVFPEPIGANIGAELVRVIDEISGIVANWAGRLSPPLPDNGEAVQKALGLIAEIERDHKDPRSCEYNQCDTDPCAWCEQARLLLSSPKNTEGESKESGGQS